MRWKNGGGITCELMRAPADSTLETFEWRVSVATVQQGGSFSRFPGVDRSLAILEGKGLLLKLTPGNAEGLDGQPVSALDTSLSLTPRAPIWRFQGETGVESSLIDGAIVDFNVMTRRACFSHTLERMSLSGQTSLPSLLPGAMLMLYVINGRCQVEPAQQQLAAGEAILLDQQDGHCRLDAVAVELMVVRLAPVNAPVAT